MSAPILVINCGSASVRAALIDADGSRRLDLRLPGSGAAAIDAAVAELERRGAFAAPPLAIGHRVAHGGERFTEPVIVDAAVEAAILALAPLSPLHNPVAVAGMRALRARLPQVPQVAVFDTAFHATLPRRSREYALPRELTQRLGIRRYGFHGTSHAFVARAAAEWLGTELERLRLVTCHLGSGASVAAVEFGRSIDTSMGMTPLEGLVMGTRPGDLDPGVILTLLRSGLGPEALDQLLNHQAGLVGLTGSDDVQAIEARAAAGDDDCRLALAVYSHRARKYVGAYAAVMGGVDAVVFTGGVGEHSALIRHRIAQRLEFLGATLDEDRNREARVDALQRVAEISSARARCRLLVVATDEELAIAAASRALVRGGGAVAAVRTIPIAISARHVHLTAASVEALFGAGHTLTLRKPISQPGQFAAAESVTLVGPRGRIEHVRVIGPVRGADQVEISRTDEFVLGVDAPVRESGDLENTPGLRIEGPAGAITLEKGVICALRHVHMNPADAAAFHLHSGDRVDVRVEAGGRNLTFGDVKVRVRNDFVLEMHVDTDEGNAAGLASGGSGVLEAVDGGGELLRRRPAAPR